MGDEPQQQQQQQQQASLGHMLPDTLTLLGRFSFSIVLPQVAVVGSQGSGKSSVLQALVGGRDFLPIATTRRPLVLQLHRNRDATDEEYGQFSHIPGRNFYDFNHIRTEIQAETNNGFSDKEIRLKIFSPSVVDITLVDLPGIPPVGDQPSDTESRITTLIMSYISDPSYLILAVTPANTDLAKSHALQIAGNADPDRYRTIGVITMLDIPIAEAEALNFKPGYVIPLQLGYTGVVNRSQEDIMLDQTVKDALAAEEEFFRSRPVYNEVANACGMPKLAKKLDQILAQHVKTVLLGLKAQFSAAPGSLAQELASYGEIEH